MRVTSDIDATFSRRLALPYKKLTASFTARGKPALLYFDANYDPTFALMHRDFEQDAREWVGLRRASKLVRVFVVSPVALAVSKVSRFSDEDRLDIQALARLQLFMAAQFASRGNEAMEYSIANKTELTRNLAVARRDIGALQQERPGDMRQGVRP